MSHILLTIALLCPAGLLNPGDDTLTLPEGCPAPFQGQLLTLEAYDGIAQDFAALDAYVLGLRVDRDDARLERDKCLSTVASIEIPECGPIVQIEGATWWHVGGAAVIGLTIGAIMGAIAL